MRVLRTLAVSLLSAALVLQSLTSAARAEAPSFGPHDLRSTFYVAKSENQNQVHYALRLDATCTPVGKRPVFAYWQRLKHGRRVEGELDGLGTTVYGASEEQKVLKTAKGSAVEMHVKALKKVRITIEVEKTERGCQAVAYTNIQGQRARLQYAYLQLGALGVLPKYVDVVGFRLSDGKRVSERHKS